MGNLKIVSDVKKRQDTQAEKMKKRQEKYAKESGAAIGAIVRICNDRRDIKNPRCTFGVIYEVSESAGGILVSTEHGILVSGVKRRPYWVPSDRYEVMAAADDEHAGLCVTPKLEQIHKTILDGKFDRSTAKTCSLSEEQKSFLGASPVRALSGCKCKVSGNATKTCARTCSCIKNKRPCSSKCLCNGNCLANKYNH